MCAVVVVVVVAVDVVVFDVVDVVDVVVVFCCCLLCDGGKHDLLLCFEHCKLHVLNMNVAVPQSGGLL
jgi:hypothetical protein